MQAICEKFRHAEGKRGRPAKDALCHCGQVYADHEKVAISKPAPVVEEPVEEIPIVEEIEEAPEPVEEPPREFSPEFLALLGSLVEKNGTCPGS